MFNTAFTYEEKKFEEEHFFFFTYVNLRLQQLQGY